MASDPQDKQTDCQINLAAIDEQQRVRAVIEQSEALPENLKSALLARLESAPLGDSSSDQLFGVKRALDSLKRAPIEVVQRVGQRVDEFKGDRVGQVKSEVKRLIERVDVQAEVTKLLSKVSIELRTNVRLVPKDDSPFGVKPVVKTNARLRWNEEREDHSDAEDPQN